MYVVVMVIRKYSAQKIQDRTTKDCAYRPELRYRPVWLPSLAKLSYERGAAGLKLIIHRVIVLNFTVATVCTYDIILLPHAHTFYTCGPRSAAS